jgi:sugar lactone lactonase YvrE
MVSSSSSSSTLHSLSSELHALPLYTPTLLVEVPCLLGEGPVWDAQTQTLYWVDIKRSTLWRWDWAQNQVKSWVLQIRPSALALCTLRHTESRHTESILRDQRYGLIIAAEQGIYHFNSKTDHLKKLLSLPEPISNRTNDGRCDPFGDFWIGTMDDQEQEDTGGLYRIDADLAFHKYQDHIGVSNTLAWHPPTNRFYFADSKKQTIFQYTYTQSTHQLSSPSPWLHLDDAYPDGSCIDQKGNLWNCQWDGHRIRQYSSTGDLIQSCALQVPRPTSCTLGGPNLDLLFITSASIGLDADQLSQAPLSGSLWVMRVEEKGIEESTFILNATALKER